MTEPSALQYLQEHENFSVLVADPSVLERPGLRPAAAFHTKAYLFPYEDHARAIVGSANLTEAALSGNTEIVGLSESVSMDACTALWDDLIRRATVLDSDLLQAYEDARAHLPQPPAADEPAPAPGIKPNALRSFWEALEEGDLDPGGFDRFWIEAGTMSSGGSHNQLELPRGANRLFGFHFAHYGDNHATIGHPRLISGSRVWTHRPLTWHGNNRMERINLPTQARGGFEYGNAAILFRRREDGFELVVVPWNSSIAESWRRASSLNGQLYRLGETSSRVCGLF